MSIDKASLFNYNEVEKEYVRILFLEIKIHMIWEEL